MRSSQFNFLQDSFGDMTANPSDRWKCVKYITHDKYMIDAEKLINNNTITYIDDENIGAGFYILGYPNSDLGLEDANARVITFFPLESVITMGIKSKYILQSLNMIPSGNNTQIIID